MAMEFSIGGFNVKGWMVAVALPVLSTVSGGVYFGYDTLNRFYGVEGGVEESINKANANAKQILELQKSLTKLETDTARERTANKTFAANQLTTASQAIAKELQETLEKNFNLFKINENELIKNYNSLLYRKNETSIFSGDDMSKFQGKIIKVDIDGEITIRVSNKQLSKYSESEIKLII